MSKHDRAADVMDTDTHVYRLHVKPKGGEVVNFKKSFEYCLKHKVLGVGWGVEKPPKPLSWKEYEKRGSKAFRHRGGIGNVRYLHDRVMRDDLIWTRDTQGKYYLAKVDGPWEYLDTRAGLKADIVNVVRCHILAVPQPDYVPGNVVACFRPARAIQAIMDERTVWYSQLLWNHMVGREEYKLPRRAKCDVLSFLDAKTTEDVICIYLQCRGWIVVPSSRKPYMKGLEFVLIHKKSHERAVVQVKAGNAPLPADCLDGFKEKIFLFQTNGYITGTSKANVVKLASKTIERFMIANIEIMPRAVKLWVEFAATLNSSNADSQGAGPMRVLQKYCA